MPAVQPLPRTTRLILRGLALFFFAATLFVAPAAAQLPDVRAELDAAYALLRAEKLEEAAAAFARMLERDPRNRTARLELGYLSGKLGRFEDAAKYLGSVSLQEPANLRLRMDYGYALEKIGRLDDAAAQFRAVAEQPGELQSQARAALDALQAQQASRAARDAAKLLLRRDAFLNRGYARLRENNRPAALEEFRQALALDPTNVSIRKQIGYLALQDGDLPLAVEHFEAARQQEPNDPGLALQLGYLYERLSRYPDAEAAFAAATTSNDDSTRRSARAALKNLRDTHIRHFYLDVFAGPLYSTRFSNGILDAVGRLHWRPEPRVPVSIYLNGRVTRDSRSRGGNLPAVFSDNVGLLGAGLALEARRFHVSLLAEANLAFNLTQTPQRNRATEPDYRVVGYFYRRWESRLYGPLGLVTAGRSRSERLFTDYDASLGYYSRYDHNVIGYLQIREGLRLADVQAARLFGYAKFNLIKDSNRDFFNNLGEVGAGLELRPHREVNLGLRLEYLHGIYYGLEGRDANPFGSRYNDVRVSLLFGRRF
jgi:tetratricopeptide (TPR) repeat protein